MIMGRLNLQSLIDEVLTLVKNRQSNDEKAIRSQQIMDWNLNKGGIRDGYTPLDRDILTKKTEIEKQRLVNEGQANVANINEAGALARQQLSSDASKYTADIGLKGHEATAGASKYTADQSLAARKYEVDVGNKGSDSFSTLMSKAIESDPSILSDPKKLAETAQNIRGMFPPEKSDTQNFNRPDTATPSVTTPVRTPTTSSASTVPAVPEKSNIGQQARATLISPQRIDRPEDYNIFGYKKPAYRSDFIDYSGSAPVSPQPKKKIADMSEEEVIAEQNLFNKKYASSIGGTKMYLPFTPTSPMDEWRKAKYGK
jgi:hypothetical protein